MTVNRSQILQQFKYTDNLSTAVNLFKQLGVLIGQINVCFRQIVLPAILMYTICVNILGAYVTLTLNGELFANVGNWLLPFLTLETYFVIMGLGTTAGFINKTSIEIVTKLRVGMLAVVEQNGEDTRYMRRMISACRPMKIRFGSNYVDILTPLVMTCFCTRTLVRLLLCF